MSLHCGPVAQHGWSVRLIIERSPVRIRLGPPRALLGEVLQEMTINAESNMSAKSKSRFSSTFVIVMTLFIDAIGFGIIIPLLPFYAQTLQAGSAALGVLVASFALMQFFFSPVLGHAYRTM